MNGSNPGDDSSDPDEDADQDRDRGNRNGDDERHRRDEPSSEHGSSATDGPGSGPGDDSGRGSVPTSDAPFEMGSDNAPAPTVSSDVEADSGRPAGSRSNDVTIEDDGVVRWFLKSSDGTVVFVRDILSSVAIVVVIGLILFGISGVWPPLVAVESGSMEPNMERGDLVFVVDDDRFVGDDPAADTGIVTLEDGQESGHEKFGGAGDVVIFRPDGDDRRTPVIHRAHFWVEDGENWVDTRADDDIIGDATCADVRTCPAPHDGFVTKGDANSGYDQHENEITTVVRPEWVTGKASFRVPWLGHVRLAFDAIFGGMLAPSPVIDAVPATPIDTVSASSIGFDAATTGLAGAAGLAGAGAGVAMATGRYGN